MNEDPREFFGLENVIIHSMIVAETPVKVIPLQAAPRKNLRALAFISRAAVLLIIFSFLFLMQDFMFHYVTKPAPHRLPPSQPSAEAIPDGYVLPAPAAETPVTAEEDMDFSRMNALANKVMPPLPLKAEEAIIEEVTEESTSNATHEQQPVDIKEAPQHHTDSVFYIIASTFKSQANADRLYFQMFRTGKTAYLLHGRDGMHRVGVARFRSRESAEKAALDLREKGRLKDAWVYAE